MAWRACLAIRSRYIRVCVCWYPSLLGSLIWFTTLVLLFFFRQKYTPNVVTLWYRAPEILLGAEQYHSAADMWSVGCIFGELLLNSPFLPGSTELEQLTLIFQLLGSPNSKIWPGFDDLPVAASRNVPFHKNSTLGQKFPNLSENGKNLLRGLLYYDPAKRLTAEQALQHEYFKESPLPTHPHLMPYHPSSLPTGPGPTSSASATASASSSSAAAAAASSLLVKRKAELLSSGGSSAMAKKK